MDTEYNDINVSLFLLANVSRGFIELHVSVVRTYTLAVLMLTLFKGNNSMEAISIYLHRSKAISSTNKNLLY